jgi:gas vesicle protein
VNLNKLVKVALSTGLYLLEQSDKATASMRERVKDRISDQIEDLTDRAREAFSPEDHTLRNVLSLAAGVGAGVAIGMLCAPAKGEELRTSIAGKVQDASSKFRQRFSSEERAATGTTG